MSAMYDRCSDLFPDDNGRGFVLASSLLLARCLYMVRSLKVKCTVVGAQAFFSMQS